MEKIILKSKYDETLLHLTKYEAENCVGVVQVIHGMMEHQYRYKELALKLNEIGITVITSDIRGHGKEINEAELGYMGDNKPWLALINDQITITEFIKNEYPNKPIYLFGHSMGTIIARNIIQNYDYLYNKVILSGAPNYQPLAGAGILVANLIGLFKGNKHKSNMLENMTLDSFVKSVKERKTNFDWLSYNEENVNNYINDPYCGIPFTISAYKALYHLIVSMNKKKKFKKNNINLPILIIVGKDDPCTGGVKGVRNTLKLLYNIGYMVSAHSYDEMRHEILNEKKNAEVYNDILSFLQS